jgi:hypothetical protein
MSLLLHLNDPDEDVRKASKYALKLVGPLMEAPGTNGYIYFKKIQIVNPKIVFT